MSNGRTNVTEPNSLHHPEDDEHRLEAVIESLNSRITAFEDNLESAMLAESQFRNNIQTLLNSLDAFVERHVEKDRHLTQLIEEDTQRSKEAKEEYDALASRFDDSLRRDNPTRTREWLRTVSVYLGIVISVVLMAPLHALWWLFTKTLARMGLLTSSEENTVYSTVRRRERDLARTTAKSYPSITTARYRRLPSIATSAVVDESKSRVMLPLPPKQKEAVKDGANTQSLHSLKGTNSVKGQAREKLSHALEDVNTDDDADGTRTEEIGGSKATSRYEAVDLHAETSDSDEEFFDARNGSEQQRPLGGVKKGIQGEGEDDIDRENAPRRPGWAVPAGSDETLPDLSAFPSSDFWEISDDEIQLNAQQSNEASD